jgi:RHS repeat-associated protein
VWRWDNQEPFGNDVPNENPSGLGTLVVPLRFPGQYFDRESSLAYNYYRDYDPGIGRYVQADPIQRHLVVDSTISRGEVSLPAVMRLPMSVRDLKAWWSYSYAYQSPVRYTDGFGLEVDAWCKTPPNYPCGYKGPHDDPYFSADCCVQRCLDVAGCDRWYHWVTPTSFSFCLGYYVGCTVKCNVKPDSN